MAIRIALAGNPNSGKTTMFNELTGSSQYVGNWPGVTVEKKEGKLRNNRDVLIVDLPGIYSLSPYTLEEVVTRNHLVDDRPEAVINIVDATNIERNLYLTTQLLETGRPMVLALNMMDEVHKNGDTINAKKLSELLGCPVIETSALKNMGLSEAVSAAQGAARSGAHPRTITFNARVEQALSEIDALLPGNISEETRRYYAIKLFEQDEKIIKHLALPERTADKMAQISAACAADLDDDAESIIANQRYEFVGQLVRETVKKKRQGGMSMSDKIDRIVTNRILALPIFFLVMWFVYYISVTTIGTIVTDWTNDTLFGEMIMGNVGAWLESINTAPWLSGLIVEGIIGGVGAVLGFVPQMFVLFFFLSILEDCGYMARIAFIMDRLFRRFGLSGKSFIPMLISSGCGVPGIMATRTIENDKDRRMTMMLTTFIPCGAKLPIIALIGGAFFPESSWVSPLTYFIGIALIILSGIILKKTRLFAGDPAPFVMELPPYRIPAPKSVLLHMWERGSSFIVKAGTVIFVSAGVIWFLSSFGWNMQMVDDPDVSMLASVGRVIAPLLAPLGFGTWQGAVTTISALVAKENVVTTFGVLFGIAEAAEDDPNLIANLATMFTPLTAFAFMAFNLYNPPCFAAIGALKREMGGWKWTLISIAYQTLLAYTFAFIVYQLGSVLFFGAAFGVGPIIAVALIAAVIWLLVRRDKNHASATHTERAKTSV